MLLTVWIVVAVLALLALGILGYGLVGALGRFSREVRALQRDAEPLVRDAQAAAAKAAEQRTERSATAD